MNRHFALVALALAALSAAGCGAKKPTQPSPLPRVTLASAVADARRTHGLPALAAASFTLDSIDVAADGVRRLGAPAAVTAGDLFHVGSLAKGMTATAVAKLVDQGALAWTLTLAEAFPEFVADMDTAYRAVTLAELLQNRAGLPGINDLEEFLALPPFAGDPAQQRRAFAGWLLAQPPAGPRGGYGYSTAGFAIAAAIAERASGRAWDALLRESVLDPIGARLFVGWPLEAGADQPSGHMVVGGALQPVDPSAGHVPAVVAPGGDASMTTRDYARFAQLHLRALCGRPSLLSPATWQKLHAPVGDYAMGWSVIGAADNVALTHTGSAETFYAFVVLYRNQRHGFVVVTNATSPGVDGAIADIVTAMAPTMGTTEVFAPLGAALRNGGAR